MNYSLQISKALFSAMLLLLTLGCTSTYKIAYSISSAHPTGFTSDDFKAISESLQNDPDILPPIFPSKNPPDTNNTFYLSRHVDAHEILVIEQDDTKLLFTVTRLTTNLGDFSEAWKEFFIAETEKTIEQATNKTTSFRQLID